MIASSRTSSTRIKDVLPRSLALLLVADVALVLLNHMILALLPRLMSTTFVVISGLVFCACYVGTVAVALTSGSVAYRIRLATVVLSGPIVLVLATTSAPGMLPIGALSRLSDWLWIDPGAIFFVGTVLVVPAALVLVGGIIGELRADRRGWSALVAAGLATLSFAVVLNIASFGAASEVALTELAFVLTCFGVFVVALTSVVGLRALAGKAKL